jgi:hypothetical protein
MSGLLPEANIHRHDGHVRKVPQKWLESAEDGARFYASGALNRANGRRVFVPRPMRSDVVIKAGPVPTLERVGPDDCENLQD